MFFIFLLLLSTTYQPISGGFVINLDMEPDITCCMPDGKWGIHDWSNLKLVTDFKAETVYFNGTLKFLKDVNGLYAVNFTTEHFQFGKWEPGDFKFYTGDYCKFMNDPLGQPVVYLGTQKAKGAKKCPFKAGVR